MTDSTKPTNTEAKDAATAKAASTSTSPDSGAAGTPSKEDPAATAPEGGAGAAGEAGDASTTEAKAGTDSASGDNSTGGEGEGEGAPAEVTADDVTKKSLQQQAAEAGLDTDGSKDEIHQRLVDEGIAPLKPQGKNGCLTDPNCVRPAHSAVPLAHAYGLQTGI